MIDYRRLIQLSIFSTFLTMFLPACEQKQEMQAPIVQEVVSIKISSMNETVDGQALPEQGTGDAATLSNGSEDPAVALSSQSESSDEPETETDPLKEGSLSGVSQKGVEGQDALNIKVSLPDTGVAQSGKIETLSHGNDQLKKGDSLLDGTLTVDVTGDGTAGSKNEDLALNLDENSYKSVIKVDEEKAYYTGEGQINPFAPLIKAVPAVVVEESVVEEEAPTRILTPLEKLDFSQMKLVAVLSRQSGSVAMVQESSGKGYLVNIGTYIGRNSGQVIKIEKDKLVIQEQVKDHKGNVVERFPEMKLNKLDDKG